MTMHHQNCPTCGSQLTAVQTIEQRPCTSCRRLVPAGFLYCGYCATPMENTDVRARVAEVAAPAGGWPQLSAELIEVRFFLQRGQLDEAYDMLSILQRRYPGHPELADFARRGGTGYRADPQVEALVDETLAGSSSLAGQVLRRRAVQWDAPAAKGAPKKWTTAHEVVAAAIPEVEPDLLEDAPTVSEPVRKPPVRRPPKPPARSATSKRKRKAKPAAPDEVTTNKTGRPKAPKLQKPGAKKDRTRVYETVGPKPAPRPGLTIAVDALQQPAPFGGAEPPQAVAAEAAAEEGTPRKKKARGKKKGRRRTTKTARKRKLEAQEKRKKREVKFGAGVLSRYGR